MGTLLMVVEERSLMLSFQGRDVYQVGLVMAMTMRIIFELFSGDIHFDDGENWTLGSYRGINLTQVRAQFSHW